MITKFALRNKKTAYFVKNYLAGKMLGVLIYLVGVRVEFSNSIKNKKQLATFYGNNKFI